MIPSCQITGSLKAEREGEEAVMMTEMARRCINVIEVGMTPEEFCDRYRHGLTAKGDEREMASGKPSCLIRLDLFYKAQIRLGRS